MPVEWGVGDPLQNLLQIDTMMAADFVEIKLRCRKLSCCVNAFGIKRIVYTYCLACSEATDPYLNTVQQFSDIALAMTILALVD